MTNEQVKRYDFSGGRPFPSDVGAWVHYTDYASLQAAYDQMVRHHLRDHNVPVVEPEKQNLVRRIEQHLGAHDAHPEVTCMSHELLREAADALRAHEPSPSHDITCSAKAVSIGTGGCVCEVVNKYEHKADERDASRYRWLREGSMSSVPQVYADDDCNTWLKGDELDKAIDAARLPLRTTGDA